MQLLPRTLEEQRANQWERFSGAAVDTVELQCKEPTNSLAPQGGPKGAFPWSIRESCVDQGSVSERPEAEVLYHHSLHLRLVSRVLCQQNSC